MQSACDCRSVTAVKTGELIAEKLFAPFPLAHELFVFLREIPYFADWCQERPNSNFAVVLKRTGAPPPQKKDNVEPLQV